MITKKHATELAEIVVAARPQASAIEAIALVLKELSAAGAFDESRPHSNAPLDHDTADLIDILVKGGAVRMSRDALDVIAVLRAAGKLG